MYQLEGLNYFKNPYGLQNFNIEQSFRNMVAYKRESARHQIRNEEVQTYLNKKRKQLLQFYTCLYNMTNDPNEQNLNQLKEIYYHEVNQFKKLEYQANIRKIIIEQPNIDSNVIIGLVEVLKLEPMQFERYSDKLNFFISLFDVFQDRRRVPESYLAFLTLIYEMLVQDENLVSSIAHFQVNFEKLLEPFFNYNKFEAQELGRICERIFRDELFTYNLKNKSQSILNLFQIASSGEHCEDNAEAICRLTYLLKQVSQLNRTQLLKDLVDLIPEQLNIMTFNNNYFPFIAQRVVIYCVINAGFQEQQLYLQYFYQILNKLPTLQQVFDFFEIFWLSISNKGPQIKQSTRRIFSQNGFWYLIKQVFSIIIQNCPLVDIHQLIYQYNVISQYRASHQYYQYQFVLANTIIETFYISFHNY